METLEMIYLYVVLMDYAKSFWALHFTFKYSLSRCMGCLNLQILATIFEFN